MQSQTRSLTLAAKLFLYEVCGGSRLLRSSLILCSLMAILLPGEQARATIIGIQPGTFTYNHTDAGSPPVVGSDLVQLTTGHDQTRSLWFNSPQDISTGFAATFTYRASSIEASVRRQGLTFVVQNSSQGTAALGLAGTSFGFAGIDHSMGMTIEADTGPGKTYSGAYTNGTIGGGSAVVDPVNAFSLRDIDVTILYDQLAGTLSVSMIEGTNSYGPTTHLVGDLTSILGSSSGYVGFTASTFNTLGSGGGASQFVSNFRFHNVPEPSTFVLTGLGALGLLACRPRRRSTQAKDQF